MYEMKSWNTNSNNKVNTFAKKLEKIEFPFVDKPFCFSLSKLYMNIEYVQRILLICPFFEIIISTACTVQKKFKMRDNSKETMATMVK